MFQPGVKSWDLCGQGSGRLHHARHTAAKMVGRLGAAVSGGVRPPRDASLQAALQALRGAAERAFGGVESSITPTVQPLLRVCLALGPATGLPCQHPPLLAVTSSTQV